MASIRAETPEGPERIAAYGRLYLGGVEQGLGCLCAALAIEGEALPERLRRDIVAFFRKHLAWMGACAAISIPPCRRARSSPPSKGHC
jgi:TetR/AcrR family transcriptional repressor of nem operon